MKQADLKRAAALAAAVLVLTGTVARGQVVIAGTGSLWLEAGQASAASQGCAWDSGSTRSFTLTDNRFSPGLTDIGVAWVTWTPSAAGNCATYLSGSAVVYISADSTVGNRCFFARPACTVTTTATTSTSPGGALPGVTEADLPSLVLSQIDGAGVNVAATELRSEDSLFATERALAGCGYPVAPGSLYLGLGYTNGSKITGSTHQTNGGGGSYNVANFAITGNDPTTSEPVAGNWTVTEVGATPIVVFVNPGNGGGMGSLAISNVNREALAGFPDGTYGRTLDIIPQQYSATSLYYATVYLREPLSDDFNVMEFATPNSLEGQSSQEIGLATLIADNAGIPYPSYNCTSYPPTSTNTWYSGENPLNETDTRGTGTSYRERAIGTSNEIKAVLATTDSLGYASWSAANFSSTTAETAKYLTVNGVDPIQEFWTDGWVPTSNNDLLQDVNFAHVKDGSYPIWTMLRFVSYPGTEGATVAVGLASNAEKFLSPSQPDFVPLYQLDVVRSHFSPPGVSYPGGKPAGSPANGTGMVAEAGGDVGGLVLTLQSDGDYNIDNGATTGNVGRRQ
jgi:hypothetical protein